MASLTAMTALGGDAARDEVIGGIRISEVADTDLASMAVRRGGDGDVETAAAKMFGGLAAGGSLSKGGDSIIWMGVDQYLVEAAPDTGSRKSAATRLAASSRRGRIGHRPVGRLCPFRSGGGQGGGHAGAPERRRQCGDGCRRGRQDADPPYAVPSDMP